MNNNNSKHSQKESNYSQRYSTRMSLVDRALVATLIGVVFVHEILIKEQRKWQQLLWETASQGPPKRMKLLIRNKNYLELSDAKSSNGDTLLHVAIKSGQLEIAILLVNEGKANVQQTDKEGNTPLHLASRAGYVTIVQCLIVEGAAKIEARNHLGFTPLFLACRYGRFEVVKCLVQDFSARTDRRFLFDDKNGQSCSVVTGTLLHHIVHSVRANTCLQLIQWLLLQTNASIFATDDEGNTLLHVACKRGQLEIVKWIIQFDRSTLSTEHRNHAGELPLHVAFSSGRVPLIKFLLAQKWTTPNHPLSSKDNHGNTPIHAISQIHGISWPDINQFLKSIIMKKHADVNVRNNEGLTPLHIAVRQQAGQMVAALAKLNSIKLNTQNHSGDTALMDAVQLACRNDYRGSDASFEMALCLAKQDRVNLNIKNKDKKTALHLAIERVELVRVLLERNQIDVNARDKHGDTLLHKACFAGKKEIVNLLIHDERTDMNLLNLSCNTPLHIACRREKVSIVASLVKTQKVQKSLISFNKDRDLPVHLACQAKVRYGRRHKSGCDAMKLIEALVSSGPINVNYGDKNGDTPIHTACNLGRLDLLECLFSNASPRVDVYVFNKKKDTPLHLACRKGRLDLVQCLMKKGKPYVNAANRHGVTPIHETCSLGQLHLFHCPLQGNRGGEISKPNKKRDTPLMLACQSQSKETLDLIFWMFSKRGAVIEVISARHPQNVSHEILPPHRGTGKINNNNKQEEKHTHSSKEGKKT